MEADRKRDGGGRYVSTRDPEDVLDAMEPLEPYTTGELVDALGWPRRSVYKSLDELAEDGAIRKKKPDPRRAIWIRPVDGAEVPA
jgi:DNA-binding IclR family transcriptional regulator